LLSTLIAGWPAFRPAELAGFQPVFVILLPELKIFAADIALFSLSLTPHFLKAGFHDDISQSQLSFSDCIRVAIFM